MRARLLSAAVVSLVACNQNQSPLDRAVADQSKHGGDPWSASGAKDQPKKNGDGFGGLDFETVIQRIRESLDTPGPYEAPKSSADFDAAKPHWGVLGLDGEVIEREAFSLTGGGRGTELRELVGRLRGLAKDDKLQGLLVRFDGLEISLPDLGELRAAMMEFRATKKQLLCHAESATNAMYVLLTACDKIALAPLGAVMISGPAAMPIHVKALLDKLSIQADFIHVGAYKGAAEPLTRDAPSKEMVETLNAILDVRYQTLVDDIAKSRRLEPAAVKAMIDTMLFSAEAAKLTRLIDDVVTWEAFRDGVKAPWTKLELDPDEGKDDQVAAMMKIARFLGAVPPERPVGDHVAVVYALGNIKDGSGDGVLGAREEIASHTLVSALRAIGKDTSVKAVVLRIDSGGGSAQASELIWETIEELKRTKPVIVSMSDVAASGGYYIAAGATKIFAHANTLTGSIGVVGGHIAPAQALSRIGVNTFPMGRGRHATMTVSLKPWTVDERALMTGYMTDVYDTFVARVAAGRNKSVEQIRPIAQGRVWTGTKALELGLVDEIGGLDAAIAEAKRLAKVDAKSELEVYPPALTLRDLLSSFGQVTAPLGLGTGEATLLASLRAVDPQVSRAAERLLELVASFRMTQIQTIAILPELR